MGALSRVSIRQPVKRGARQAEKAAQVAVVARRRTDAYTSTQPSCAPNWARWDYALFTTLRLKMYRIIVAVLMGLSSSSVSASPSERYVCTARQSWAVDDQGKLKDSLSEFYAGERFTVDRQTGLLKTTGLPLQFESLHVLAPGNHEDSFIAIAERPLTQKGGEVHHAAAVLLTIEEYRNTPQKPFFFAAGSLIFTGVCQSTTDQAALTAPIQPARQTHCEYKQQSGPAYKVEERSKEFVNHAFFFDPEQPSINQRDVAAYSSLLSHEFKVIERSVMTSEGRAAVNMPDYRYADENYHESLYHRDRSHSTKVLTEDCTEFYLSGTAGLQSVLSMIVHANGAEIMENDVFQLYGPKAFKPVNTSAHVEFNTGTRIFKLTLPQFNDHQLQAQVDLSGRIVALQLLGQTRSFHKDRAVLVRRANSTPRVTDHQGTQQKKVSVQSDGIDCVPDSRCELRQQLTIDLNPELLQPGSGGFRLTARWPMGNDAEEETDHFVVPLSLVQAMTERLRATVYALKQRH